MRTVGYLLAIPIVSLSITQSTIAQQFSASVKPVDDQKTIHSPLLLTLAENRLRCWAVNVTSKPINSVHIAIVTTGSAITDGTCKNVAPNTECAIVDDSGLAAHCKVTVSGGANKVRAVFAEFENKTDDIRVFVPFD
jgi:hypothetical protein